MLIIERKTGNTWEPFVWPGAWLSDRDYVRRRLAEFGTKYGELRLTIYERAEVLPEELATVNPTN